MVKSLTVIIPIFNEEVLLEKNAIKLLKNLKKIYKEFEILLVENGSTDKTYEVANKLAKKYSLIKVLRLKNPCYGLALKLGINKAQSETIVQFDIDFIDTIFLKRAVELLKSFDIVIGSKLHPESQDLRPIGRVFLTKIVNLFIKTIFKYQGTDTHGIKAYKKTKIKKIINKNITRHHFFETEFMLRAAKENFKIIELPVKIEEIRRSRFPTTTRVIEAIKEVFLLIIIRKQLIS